MGLGHGKSCRVLWLSDKDPINICWVWEAIRMEFSQPAIKVKKTKSLANSYLP